MAVAEEVVVDLIARQDRLERELRRAAGTVDQRLGGMERRGQQFASRFGSLLGAAAGTAVARVLLNVADQAKQIDAQLRLATASFGSFSKAQEDARRIAETTRTSLEATTKLYGAFTRSAEQTGRTQDDASRATETFSKALKIGGAGAQEAASATLQFNQALASGVLRGEEFNAIAEASPRILRLLADALGVPQGQLRALAAEGKITSDQLFAALTDRRFTQGIDDEFRTLPVTFSEAMQQVENAAIITFGAFDRGGEFSTALANFITDGTGGFEELESAALTLGIEIRSAFAGLGDVFDPLLDGARNVFAQINGEVASTRASIASLLGAYDSIVNFLPKLANQAKAIDNRFGFNYQYESLSDTAGTFTRGFDQTARNRRRDVAQQDFDDSFVGKLGFANGRLTGAGSSATGRRSPVAAGGGSKRAASAADKAAREAERAAETARRNNEAFANDIAGLNDAILRERASEATSAADIARFESERVETARQRFEAETNNDKRFTDAQKAQLIALNNLLAASQQAAVAADLAKAAFEGAADDIDNIVGDIERRGDQRLGAANEAAEARANRPFAQFTRDTQDAVNSGIEGIAVDQIVDNVENLSDVLGEAAAGFLGLKGAAGEAVSSIIADLAKLALQQGILALIGAFGGAVGGSTGGGGFNIGSILGGFGRASGGPVSAGSMYRVNEGAAPGRSEFFKPNTGGKIIPLGQIDSIAPQRPSIVQPIISVDARGAVMNDKFADMILARADATSRAYAGVAGKAAVKAAPDAIRRNARFET